MPMLALLLWLNLFIATNQNNTYRWAIAGTLSFTLIFVSFYEHISTRINFSKSPIYVNEIEPPMLQFTPGVTEEQLLKKAADIF